MRPTSKRVRWQCINLFLILNVILNPIMVIVCSLMTYRMSLITKVFGRTGSQLELHHYVLTFVTKTFAELLPDVLFIVCGSSVTLGTILYACTDIYLLRKLIDGDWIKMFFFQNSAWSFTFIPGTAIFDNTKFTFCLFHFTLFYHIYSSMNWTLTSLNIRAYLLAWFRYWVFTCAMCIVPWHPIVSDHIPRSM